MANISNTVNLNIKIDNQLKKEATSILNDLGLNMSVAVNMFLTQVVKKQAIPFEITQQSKPNRNMRKALKEAEKIANNPNRKTHRNVDELMKELMDE